jgi:hypothetical protein
LICIKANLIKSLLLLFREKLLFIEIHVVFT